jgi:hypothetical protein
LLTEARSLRDRNLGTLRQQHPDGNLQLPPGWIHDTDRSISSLRSAKNPQGSTMKRVKGVEDLNICIIGAQGIVGVVVPGGGISLDGTRWVACRPNFLLAVEVLSCLFRRLVLEKLAAGEKKKDPAAPPSRKTNRPPRWPASSMHRPRALAVVRPRCWK